MMDEGYPEFSRALNKTGRPIVFSCSWPAYLVYMEIKVSVLGLTNEIAIKLLFIGGLRNVPFLTFNTYALCPQ